MHPQSLLGNINMGTSVFDTGSEILRGIATGSTTMDWISRIAGESGKRDATRAAIESYGKVLTEQQDTTTSDENNAVLDRDWTKAAFLISDTDLDDVDDRANRYYSSAENKFTDTRMGGNLGVNARPQFTRYADTKIKGRIMDRKDVSVGGTTGNLGMGRYYSEAIDDNAQTVYLRFGVPQFNSLTNFISKAFNKEMTILARTGRAPSAWYTLGRIIGNLAPLIAFPVIACSIHLLGAIGDVFQRPTSKFYTVKPTMYQYWIAVTHLVNNLAVNRGILPKLLNEEQSQSIGKPYELDQDYLTMLHGLMPDIFTTQNYLDIPAMANKAARQANKLAAADYAQMDRATASTWTGYVQKDATGDGSHPTYLVDDKGDETLKGWVDNMLALGEYYGSKEDTERLDVDPRIDLQSEQGDEYKNKKYDSFGNHFGMEVRMGSQFAIFKVDHTGSVTETFGSAVTESDISQKLNSISSQTREARFSFGNGNIGDNAFVNMAESAVGAIGDLATGGLDSIFMGFGGLMAGLAGSGFIDIPKHWQSSTANLAKSNYSMDLISPYGNAYSQLQNIYIPICMLLAGALPIATGKASYTSPFLCQLFDQGRCQIKIGMIESLTITRGITNLPFDRHGNALSVNVSFSVVDLSSILHMPISSGMFGDFDATLDEDNILSDYLAVLGGQDVWVQEFGMSKAKLAIAKKIMGLGLFQSKAAASMMIHDKLESMIPTPIYKVMEGLTRNVMSGE